MRNLRVPASISFPLFVSILLALVALLVFAGCATRPIEPPPAPVLHARYQKQSIRCDVMGYCQAQLVEDCEDYGGLASGGVVELTVIKRGIPTDVRVECSGTCRNGVEVSHDCKATPEDWRVAEVRR